MSKNEIMKKVSSTFTKVMFKLKKHSPEILIAAGVVGTVTSAVIACKASTKVSTIIDDAREQLEAVHEAEERYIKSAEKDEETNEAPKYTREDAKKDTAIIYIRTGAKLARLYAPAITLGVFSLSSIIISNNILRKRNAALASAYAAVDKSFRNYRERVIERFGDEVDKQLKYNIKAVEIEENAKDKKGNDTRVKKTVNAVEGQSEYARYFERGETPYWDNCPEYNTMFIESQQRYANDRLIANGFLFLNDVYEDLGFPKTKAGQIVGWVYDPENPKGDNYIDFGMMEIYRKQGDDYVPTILLDFNVDGNILDLI